MTFLAAFSASGAPIDIKTMAPTGVTSRDLRSLGPNREVQFLRWSLGEESRDVCSSSIYQLGERLFLVGRPRLDRRKELAERLGANEAEADALLCLRSYALWGERCVEHLRGDFNFVIWDEARGFLFCARDQLGVRPLFYEQTKSSWWISDSLKVLASLRDSEKELDELWIGDFLTRSFSLDFDRTVYREIRRLPPAHKLRITAEGGQPQRYWALEPGDPIHYRREAEYFERFHELLARAVSDRLPEGRVGIMMSGGVDSTTLAAKAVERTADCSRVVGFTAYSGRSDARDDLRLSTIAARKLGVAHTLVAVDDLLGLAKPIDVSDAQEPGAPSLLNPARLAMEDRMAALATVWFEGEGPDNALTFEWKDYLRWLYRRAEWKNLVMATGDYLAQKKARDWYSSFRKVRPRAGNGASSSRKPSNAGEWLNPQLAERLDARDSDLARRPKRDWWRPGAMESFTSAIWPAYFEVWDPATSGSRLDFRHPYVDLELLDFMLRTPPIPWGRRKALIRRAMRGRLPQEILDRDKIAVSEQPSAAESEPKHCVSSIVIGEHLRRFIDPARFVQSGASCESVEKIAVLDAWLQGNGFGSSRPT